VHLGIVLPVIWVLQPSLPLPFPTLQAALQSAFLLAFACHLLDLQPRPCGGSQVGTAILPPFFVLQLPLWWLLSAQHSSFVL
jgi:hypothetical protein